VGHGGGSGRTISGYMPQILDIGKPVKQKRKKKGDRINKQMQKNMHKRPKLNPNVRGNR